MEHLVPLLVFAFGACVGSFLNVVIARLPEEQSLLRPGSRCPLCGHPIRWHDNIPILGWLILGGRCRHCRGHISPRYPLVELLGGVLAFALFLRYGPGWDFSAYFLLACALLVCTFIDLDHKVIFEEITLPGIVLGLLFSLALPGGSFLDSLIGAASGALWLGAVGLGYRWLRKREGLGFGDVELVAMIGAFLGWKAVVFTILLGSISGAVVGSAVLLASRRGLSEHIPFGPFLALGGIAWPLGGDVLMRAWLGW